MNIPFDCPIIIVIVIMIIHMINIVLCTTKPMHEYNPELDLQNLLPTSAASFHAQHTNATDL